MTTLVLIAKEPIPGRVKTRLHPTLSFSEAAELAAASIDDTIEAMRDVPATHRILLFDGERPPASASAFEVIPQSMGDLDARLAAIFDARSEPILLIGMDTPQISAADVHPVFHDWPAHIDAWFGPANDGGFWALGMREPTGDVIRGVPMSRDDTGAIQLQRLAAAGLTVGLLPTLTDVDTIADAIEVAQSAPRTSFAQTLNRFSATD